MPLLFSFVTVGDCLPQSEELISVPRRKLANFLGRFAQHFGNFHRDEGNEGRLIHLAAMRDGRQVGCVRLNQQTVQRTEPDRLANLFRVFESEAINETFPISYKIYFAI